MDNTKGSVSIGLIITIVVIIGATMAGIGYFAMKNLSNSSDKTNVTNNSDGASIKLNDGDDDASIKVGKDGASIKLNDGDDDASIKVGKDGASIKLNDGDDDASIKLNDGDSDKKATVDVSTVLIFDASGSMSQQISGDSRINMAKKAVSDYVDGLKDNVNISVLVYGQKGNNTQAGKKESCEGIEEIYYMGPANSTVIKNKINALHPNGWTPITESLKKAEKILSKTNSKTKHILLLSDGKETCGSEPVSYAKKLKTEGITIDVIGLGVDEKTKIQLNDISISGGGNYISVNNKNDFSTAINNMESRINAGDLSISTNGVNSEIKADGNSIKIQKNDIKVNTPGMDMSF